ncbi:guanidinobutyrase-like [Penaeus monodon]|uniref:guanidinobutyrase-like n=1 Tax=Penaeus monodon TaxID=6687 RepID=UPI0018A7586C|nr:guanidinobutyrase-like [Penaeus monodon]
MHSLLQTGGRAGAASFRHEHHLQGRKSTQPLQDMLKKKKHDRYGTVCLLHVDAHNDVSDSMLGAKITHGTPFRRAVEEDLIDPKATVQIGLRGSSYTVDAHAWQISKGFHIVQAHQCWHKSLEPLMKEVKA